MFTQKGRDGNKVMDVVTQICVSIKLLENQHPTFLLKNPHVLIILILKCDTNPRHSLIEHINYMLVNEKIEISP